MIHLKDVGRAHSAWNSSGGYADFPGRGAKWICAHALTPRPRKGEFPKSGDLIGILECEGGTIVSAVSLSGYRHVEPAPGETLHQYIGPTGRVYIWDDCPPEAPLTLIDPCTGVRHEEGECDRQLRLEI